MIRYLLDTNAVSDLVRDPKGRVAQQVALVGEQQVGTSVIVAAELWYGAAAVRSERLHVALGCIMERLPILGFEPPVERLYGDLRATLERTGQVIGLHDLLIAAHALALNLIVVTDNEREFRRVPSLAVENWRRER